MSQPIYRCDIERAARGDEEAYKWLLAAYIVNLRYGHWTTFPCKCEPPCEIATDEQIDELNKKLKIYFQEHPVKQREWGYPGHSGCSGYSGYKGKENNELNK